MIHLDDLLAAAAQLGARTVGPVRSRAFDGFSYDSRNLRPGELFLAVRTEKADGHHFIPDACRRGAAGILCERVDALSACDGDTGATVLQVRDTRQALIAWAGYVLRRYAPRVVGIAGSVGKTSTQKAIVSILAPAFGAPAVFDNDNLNDLYGLPIALGRLEPHHQLAILELAADQPADLDRLARLVRPEVAVVTNVRPVLLKYLGSVERAAQEIERVVAALPAAGCFVANADDPLVARMAPPAGCRRLTVGRSPDAEVRATDIGPPSPTGRPGDGAALTPRPSPRGRGVGGEGRPVGDEGDGVDDGVTFTVVCRG
ncbi:MAG: hypothetical protein HYY04_16410, partial [Chloroflexi bacterium]|nr:hypothetical protein [Chloroflexota bacterium]